MVTNEKIPQLRVEHVTFGYDRQPLLYNVSLRVSAGERIGLLGPNGSGKTTLLRLLSGVLQPQQGCVLLEEQDLRAWGRRGAAQRIAVVPQELHVPFAFTVEHMISLGRTPFNRSFFGSRNQQDELNIQEAAEAAGVTALMQRVFNELSGGERQRVMIAMALAQQPKVLLLDEPTAHLDIKYQIETLELVQSLNVERGVTVIAAMHDLNLAARYFPRLVLFQRGIVEDASPAEVIEPELLRRVYGVNVQVGILRGTQHLSVSPPEGKDVVKSEPRRKSLVHVIAGGGSGEVMMRALADAQIPFIAGALNIGDSDHTLALRLADEVITEQPYAPISLASLERVRSSLQQVKELIICPVPIGPGNLVLLQEAVIAAQHGLPIVLLTANEGISPQIGNISLFIDDGLLQSMGIAARDYTDGEGLKCIVQLLQAGALVATSVNEASEGIKKRLANVYNSI